MPKSSSFTCPSGVTRMFAGLRSRCRTSLLCACATAARTSRNSRTRARTSSERDIAPAIQRSPSTYSSTRYGCPSVGHARVDQARDVRVIEPREHLAFLSKALDALRIDQREIEELDRGATFEAPVAATGQPHRAHAAVSERLFERVIADDAIHR